jgi:hypothetical protein
MYLQNGKFIHSSTTNGVAISSLDEAYWKARFIGARRSPDQQKMIGVLNTGVN